MANLFNLVRAFGRISSHPLASVSHERCLNRRYNRVFCNRCEQVCGVSAISFDDVPAIDGTACTGCGLCVNVCPTGAFSLRDFSKEDILLAANDAGTVIFSCRDEIGVGAGHVAVPCIWYLCEGMLISAAAVSEKVTVDASGCDKCTLKMDIDGMQQKVDVANIILELFGRAPNIELSVAWAGDTPVRDIFGRKSLNYLRGTNSDNGNSRKDGEPADNTSIIPLAHRLLFDAISSLGEPVQDTIRLEAGPLYRLEILDKEACDMCGLCAAICPTGALSLSGDEAVESLGFNMSSCIGCDMCRQVCKSNAIGYAADIRLCELTAPVNVVLMTCERMQCKRCKKYTRNNIQNIKDRKSVV